MNPKLLYVFLFLVTASCQYSQKFPSKISERILPDNTIVKLPNVNDYGAIDELFTFVKLYEQQDSAFNLETFELQYEKLHAVNNSENIDSVEFAACVEINGLLLELTGKEKYAQELEQLSISGGRWDNYDVRPFVVTKNVDHLYVNLFQPSEINYQHSLGGEVSFRQKTSYPESGSVSLHFEMTERRYIELNIRIPEWAEGTSVTVKGVKYFTKAGSYCLIAKKWKQGDLVEIELPIEKYPGLKN